MTLGRAISDDNRSARRTIGAVPFVAKQFPPVGVGEEAWGRWIIIAIITLLERAYIRVDREEG